MRTTDQILSKRLCATLGALCVFFALSFNSVSAQNDAPRADETLDIAVVMALNSSAGWDLSFREALERFAARPPEDLSIRATLYAPAPNRLRDLAESQRYDVIWAHSHASDRVEPLMLAHPRVLFVVAGDGNRPLGGAQLWVMKRLHEPSWLLGALAARLSKSGVIGVVGTVPYADVNDQMNAFLAGARETRPDIRTHVSFIDAWSGADKVDAATAAQSAQGADIVFRLASGKTPCAELNVRCFGNFTTDPDAIASALALWEADLRLAAEVWRKGSPLAAPKEGVWRGLAQHGVGLHIDSAEVSPGQVAEIERLQREIANGDRVIPIDPRRPR
ncbi:MAG: BMP family protein [Neomegalonema sp.]